MWEMLEFGFMQRALAAGAVIGVMCAVVGVFTVQKGMAFMGAGIAHASFGGVALGVWWGLHPVLTAIAFCLVVGWSIAWLSLRTATREDTLIGVFFAATMALGILVIGLVQGYQQDLFGYMFGSILAVTTTDLAIIAVCGGLVVLALLLYGKELLFAIFDPEGAAVAGLPTTFLHLLLVSMISLTVVVSIKVVGIVLVSALLITPAAAAGALSVHFGRILVLAGVIGLTATLVGLVLSFLWDTAPGATIVLSVTAVYLLSAAIRTLRH